jgi:hypothetical protein
MTMTPQRWLANILEVLDHISDKDRQERKWLAPDARVWENPGELINQVDDVVFDGFLEQFANTFSLEQRNAAFAFRDELKSYIDATPQRLNPVEVLSDKRWDAVRQRAREFVQAFRGRWTGPPAASAGE